MSETRLTETWKSVPGYSYDVSSLGRIRHATRGNILKPSLQEGYPFVSVWRAGRTFGVRVHKLVCLAFLGPRPDGYCVNHKNGDKTDNRLENLEYVTPQENERHAAAHGLKASGTRHGSAKLSETDVRAIMASSISAPRIAATYGVSATAVRQIRRGETWKRLA